MYIDIYRVVDSNGSGFLHEEVCRNCAGQKQKEGFEIEFDEHLHKYVTLVGGISFYEYGSDEENPEINCSLCGEYLVSKFDERLTESITKDKRLL